jgi:hypothetical protein
VFQRIVQAFENQLFKLINAAKIMYPAAACLHGDPWISSKKLIWTTNNTIQMDIKENFSCCQFLVFQRIVQAFENQLFKLINAA